MSVDAARELEQARADILAAVLRHAPFDGWTPGALHAGAADAGHDEGMLARAFPGGPVEALAYFNRAADEHMLREIESRPVADRRTRDRVAAAVRIRLEQNDEHREAIRRGLGTLALPGNAPAAARILYRTVDAIWRAAGDTATDHNFYTKRGLLAGVYGATVLHWLNDRSEGREATWRFLDRRIAEALAVPRALARLAAAFERLPSPLARPGYPGRRPGRPYGRSRTQR